MSLATNARIYLFSRREFCGRIFFITYKNRNTDFRKRIYFETTVSNGEASPDSNGKLQLSRCSGQLDLKWIAGLAPKKENSS